MKDMGANTLTIPVYWDQIEGKKGQADFSQVDHVIDLAEKYGMKVKLHPVVWAGNYPGWVDQEYQKEKITNPTLSEDQYTKNGIKNHIDQTLDHFEQKYGNEIKYVEINEMNSSDVLQNTKTNDFGQVLRDAKGNPELEQVHNGLTDWIKEDGPAPVINQVDGWIKEELAKNGATETKLLENEYLVDKRTQANDTIVGADANHPDGFGFQAHQFSAGHLDMNENDPLLSIYQKFHERQPNGLPNYLSELTVETTLDPRFNESKMSPEVRQAEKEAEDYRTQHGQDQLAPEQRMAQEKQAEELLAWYKMAVNGKNTMGISLWDGSEKNAWNQNTGGVIDIKNQPKTSYFMLQDFTRAVKQEE
jgi:GH35 family endo-1,4-beta-xylanase